MAALQLFKTTPRNHHHHHHRQNVASRRDSSQPFYTLMEPSTTWHGDPAAPTPPGRPQDSPAGNQTAGLSAGTIVAIVFSGLVLISVLTGAYTCASARHKPGRDRRSTALGRRVHFYNDDDIEMQAKRHTRGSLLDQRGGDHSTDKGDYQQVPYHGEGAGMGYDDDEDEDGTEARIEVGTARVARIRRVPAGSVSIRNIGRGGAAPAPMGSSQSVRDVVSLPDLAWAETLTTGGGRRPPVSCAPAAGPPPPPPPLPPATTTRASSSSKASGSERSRKLQERSESRRAVKRKAIREWCARGSGGGIGPYSAAY